MKRYLITAIKFGISISILYYLFNKASQKDQFIEALNGEKNWGRLGLAFLCCLIAHLIGMVRWHVMVRAINLPFRIYDAIRIGFIGLFFNLIAFGVIGGDALRAFYVAREFKNRKSEAIASVVADRMIGLLSMFLVASLAFIVFDTSQLESLYPEKLAVIQYVCQVVTVVTIVGFACLAVMFLTPRLHKRPWFRKLLGLPALGPILQKMFAVISVYRNRPVAIIGCFMLSGGVNLFFALSIYFIAAGLLDDFPLLRNHFVIEPIAMVSNAVPLPGGLGGMEFMLDFLYQAFGCDHGVVVAFAYRFCLLLVSAIGAVMWFFNRRQVKDLVPTEG